MKSRRRHDAGFALAGLICIITAAAVATAVVIPLRVMQSRRQTEQELIFRGQEYVRAIQKYQYKYGIYPSSIDDLISRDGYRFLRRQYKDPVTGEDFRLINVNADGSLTGSLTLLSLPVSAQPNAAPGTMAGANPGGTGPLEGGGGGGGGNSRAGVQNSANTGGGVGNVAGAGGSMGFASSGISGISNPFSGGGTTNNNNNNSRAGVGGGGVGTGAGIGGAFGGGSIGTITPGTLGGGTNSFGAPTNPLGGGGTTQPNNNTGNRPAGAGGGATGGVPTAGAPSAIPGTGFAGGGAAAQISPGVAGVASESTKTAVMIYNEKEKYNEWEFIAPRVQATQQQGAGDQQQGGNRAQQGNNNRQGPPLGNSQNPLGNPFSNPNPVTGPTQGPLGGPMSNPLGGGGTQPTTGGAGRR